MGWVTRRCHRARKWESLEERDLPGVRTGTDLLLGASLVAYMVKNLPAVQVTWVPSLGGEDPLETGMAAHSSILAWRIPWTEEPGGLQSMGLQRVRHNWTNTFTFRQKSKCRGALRLQSLCCSTVYQNSSEMKFSLNLQFFLSICFTLFMSLTEHYFLKILNSNTIVKKKYWNSNQNQEEKEVLNYAQRSRQVKEEQG